MPAFEPSYSDSLFAEACEELEIDMHSVPNARNSEAYDGRSACVGYGTCQPVCPAGAKYDATVHIERAEEKGRPLSIALPCSDWSTTPIALLQRCTRRPTAKSTDRRPMPSSSPAAAASRRRGSSLLGVGRVPRRAGELQRGGR